MSTWVTLGWCGALCALACAPARGLTLDPPTVALGAVAPYEQARQEVLLINDGNSDLEIVEIRTIPAEGAVLHAEPRRLAPGEVALLSILFQADDTLGPAEVLALLTIAGRQEPVELPICAEIRPAYRLRGDPLFFDNLRRIGGDEPQTVFVSPVDSSRGELQVGVVEDDFFHITVDPSSDARESQRVTVAPRETLPEGWTQRIVSLPAAEEGALPFRMRISAFLPPPVHVYPAELQVVRTDREQMRILFVDSYLEKPLQIERIETPGPEIQWEIVPDATFDRLRINLYIYEQSRANDEIGDVILFTNHPEVDAIRVPIRRGDRNDLSVPVPAGMNFIASRSRCGCRG